MLVRDQYRIGLICPILIFEYNTKDLLGIRREGIFLNENRKGMIGTWQEKNRLQKI
ncbi:MAG: hypothetical protein IJC02_09885 [Lachnospiraceae bacterium]|nr:hypothetical protein [Lachnospiraceae bacterium]